MALPAFSANTQWSAIQHRITTIAVVSDPMLAVQPVNSGEYSDLQSVRMRLKNVSARESGKLNNRGCALIYS